MGEEAPNKRRRGGAMTSAYSRIRKQAREFTKLYPKELPARLAFWGEILELDRVRLLRMLGLPPREAAQRKEENLADLLQGPTLRMHAEILDDTLGSILNVHHYDW